MTPIRHALSLEWSTTGRFIARFDPTALAICLELASRATNHNSNGAVIAEIGLRDLASRIGLSKDTVHRHLRHLEHACIIERIPGHTTFSPCTYLIHLAPIGISFLADPEHIAAPPTTPDLQPDESSTPAEQPSRNRSKLPSA